MIWTGHEGFTEIAQKLLGSGAAIEHKDDSGRTALQWACQEGHLATAEALLAASAQVDSVDEQGYTPLLYASNEVGPVLLVHLFQVHTPQA